MRVIRGTGARYTQEERRAAFSSREAESRRVASRRVAWCRASISGIIGGRTPIDSQRRIRRARVAERIVSCDNLLHSSPIPSRRVGAPCYARHPMRAGPTLFRWRAFFVLSHGWCLLTVARCKAAADLPRATSRLRYGRALLVDRSDGHDPENAGDTRLRWFTTRSRVEIPWVTSPLTSPSVASLFFFLSLPPPARPPPPRRRALAS